MHIVMDKIVKFIGFMVLAFALWQTGSNTFTAKAVDAGQAMDEKSEIIHQQSSACITTPQLPYLPEAELAGTGGQSQLSNYSRIQRLFTTEYIFSLKDCIDRLTLREAALSLHREKLYDATAYYRCQPVCEYYIFTLRRILI